MAIEPDFDIVVDEPVEEVVEEEATVARFVNSPQDVATVFADTCMFVTNVAGTIRLQFVEAVPGAANSPDPGTKLKYIGNLVMPLAGFKAMVSYINDISPKDDDGE